MYSRHPIWCFCHQFYCCGVVYRFFYMKKSLLHLILNLSFQLFCHSRGIVPFKADSPFESIFRPTFLSLVFMILNVVCWDVKIWFKFSEVDIQNPPFIIICLVEMHKSIFILINYFGLITRLDCFHVTTVFSLAYQDQ